jgi:hypothetical protein
LPDLRTPLNTKKKSTSAAPKFLLKPGLSLSLVVKTDLIREINDIRTSTLHDMNGKNLIVAQPDPELSAIRENHSLIVSFLNLERGRMIRYGFKARIVEFLKEYQLSSSQKAPAIILQQHSLPKPYDLRMFYRIHPPSNCGLEISVYSQPLGIINISIGGTLISATRSQDREFLFEAGRSIKVTLTIEENQFPLEAQIKRISYPENPKKGHELVFIALQFINRDQELDRVLSLKIFEIQRELRSKGLEP